MRYHNYIIDSQSAVERFAYILLESRFSTDIYYFVLIYGFFLSLFKSRNRYTLTVYSLIFINIRTYKIINNTVHNDFKCKQ